jgi:hypothetical protein
MAEKKKFFWLNLTVGILGLLVGSSYLFKLFGEVFSFRNLVMGVVCFLLATFWIIYVILSEKRGTKTN